MQQSVADNIPDTKWLALQFKYFIWVVCMTFLILWLVVFFPLSSTASEN